MYQTLYRKYRPKNFDEVVGQDIIIKTLENEIKAEQLNHAYLFTGPRGTGKTSVAKILAKTINCEQLENGKPCNQCVNCTQINNKQSNDIIEIDAASNNGVDEIRELKSKVNLVPSTGKYKVYIIDEVHMLTLGAFNALLKTLEEPPTHIIFILATTDPHKIPLTILSRCQRFDFKKISMNNLVRRLKQITELEKIEISNEALSEIARLSDGGMRDALSMLDQVIAFSDSEITVQDVHEINGTLSQEQLSDMIQYLFNHDLVAELNLIAELNDNGKNLVKLTEELIQFLRNILLYITAPGYFDQHNSNIEMYQKISREIKQHQLLKIIKEFNMTLSDMHNSNNPKLLLELLFISLMTLTEERDKLKMVLRDNERQEIHFEKIDNQTNNETMTNELPSNEDKKLLNLKQSSQSINIDSKFEQIIETRVNNALSGFTKKEFLNIKKQIEQLQTLLIDPDCSKYISIIMDSDLKAAGNDYLVFVNKNSKLTEIFNSNIIEIEDVIVKQLNRNYKVISVDVDKWNIIKNEFNSKTKQYNLQTEEYNLREILQKQQQNIVFSSEKNDEIKKLFGNIIEYEEK